MESIICDVTALDQTHRRLLEALLGHELEDHQRLYIAVLSNLPGSAPLQREQAWERIRAVTAEIEQLARQKGITPEEWAAIVDEECEAIRYGKKS